MKAISFFLIFFVHILWAEEPSAFELQSGVTKKEIQNLKGKIESQTDKIFQIENKIKQLETSNEGIKSIYEGQVVNINEINNKINNIDLNSFSNKSDLEKLQEQISNNTKNIQILTDSLKDVSESISQIKELLNQIQKIKETDKEKKIAEINETQSHKIDFQKDTTRRNIIFKEAKSLTYSKKFDEAIARYNWFIEINYKKAESYYMLGNISYAQNKYNDAIYNYKESAILDDKASYMPRLLLNCANSLRVLNKKDDAKNFYNSLISSFPDSSEAKDAKKQLNKIKD
ncbi:tol-pal system YbgF family protein [Helicobacter sp. MIT 14-3879]|uniref:tetratricopeptide repeat protein n=1 Tax=Helicobacter sp. MIT 14-3879 TaxID=2040649 RepID=UPI000E1F5D33|nr:tetratricopeptide repeat protein [Helicobacter sp. MIT 14-3879]RDU63173.1 hypothetical protein CQA44_05920 [Helicobacter sp. MIT 14-3879]